jgi:hypothetical protein
LRATGAFLAKAFERQRKHQVSTIDFVTQTVNLGDDRGKARL